MKVRVQLHRSAEVRRIRGELERDGFPRLQMFLLVALTGASGFFTSFLLLRLGVVEMWLRYLASFSVAYVIFLFLLWLWLRTRASDYDDPGFATGWSGGDTPAPGYSGKGGTFDGGGASGMFETSSGPVSAVAEPGSLADNPIGMVAEAEEFAIPLAVILVIAAMFLSSLFMIHSAPVLFAELMVDGVLSASLFRRLRGLETRHWLETALRKTALPFALTAVIVCASGWAMAHLAPGADSIGDFIAHVSQSGR